MRRVVLLPAEAEEQEMAAAARIAHVPGERNSWLGICWLKLDLFTILNPTSEIFMRLLSKKAMMLGAFVTIACRESTSPPSFTGLYLLDSVNGQQLPATFFSPPVDTFTVFFADLTLTADGNAVLVQRRRDAFQNNITENTYTTEYKYHVSGNTVTIGPVACPTDLHCIDHFEGELTGSTLRLNVGTPLVYSYHRSEIATTQ